MPRPLIGPQPGHMPERAAHPKPASAAALAARLRARRSEEYLRALASFDAGSHGAGGPAPQAVLDAIAHEFPELTPAQRPAGVVAKCGLGGTFEVHALDIARATAVHVRTREPLPDGLERARALALHPHYLFVEVSPQGMHAVREDGTIVVVATP